jgi:CRISPR-associated endonuclease/helicase Cas3
MSEDKSYFRYWGKADRNDPDRYHLLVYHCLDVAAVADVWWQSSTAIRNSLMRLSGTGEDKTKAWVMFFVALHDYGKFDLRFQRKAEIVWQRVNPEISLLPAKLNDVSIREYNHGAGGLIWFYHDLKDRFQTDDGMFIEPSEDWDAWREWFAPVAGHHGYIPEDPEYEKDMVALPQYVEARDRIQVVLKNARLNWLSVLEALFLKPAGITLAHNPPLLKFTKNTQSPVTMLAGFCSVSDWLGSSDDFPYDRYPTINLEQWYRSRLEYAKTTLKSAGMISMVKTYKGIQPLLGNFSPRQVQCLIDRLPNEQGLTLIEASTGSGKTEAAISYAWQLIDCGYADSIVFALPTQATANAMLKRVEKVAPLLFEKRSNMVLAHGRSRYNEDFIKLKQACQPNSAQGREDARVQCALWLSQSRKRVFLGQIGICTIDQVLVSVLPVKHKFVRGFGVGRSVVIVDEVHAYDAYMYGLLDAVLEQQMLAGGSAILLSATLPWHQKVQIANAWESQLPAQKKPEDITYPLITHFPAKKASDDKAIQLIDLKDLPDKQPESQIVCVDLIYSEKMLVEDALLETLLDAVIRGAQVCLVCNLVDVAQNTYRRALNRLEKIDVLRDEQLLLFHSRFTFSDRQEKENQILKLFGTHPDSYYKANTSRAIGHLLIATQVVEQSLDIDFDWLVTQLCPVDLLFQRMGRLHRHPQNHRPAHVEERRCTILFPTGLDYHWHSLIYGNSRVLWRTQQLLEKARDRSSGKIMFPKVYRQWIEPVYQEDAWPEEPESVLKSYEEFINQREASRYAAKLNIRRKVNLADSDGNVSALTRDGEMGLDVIPVYNDSQGRQCLLDRRDIYALSDEERFEALNLNSVSVPASWGRNDRLPEADQNGYNKLEMSAVGDAYTCEYGPYRYRYHPNIGLQRIE